MEENLMNYKIIADYAYEEQERLGKKSGGSMIEYEKATERYKIAKNKFIQKMNSFADQYFIRLASKKPIKFDEIQ